MTAIGHSPDCRCDTCGYDATIANIARLEAELLDGDA